MQCRDCLNGTHVRTEVEVLAWDTVMLRRNVCVCGVCPKRCPARPVAVETAERWHHQHRDGQGAVLVAPAEVWAARAAAARAAAARDAAARAGLLGRHRAQQIGRAPGPTPGGQQVGELAIGGVGGQPRHGIGVICRSTPAASSPARYELDQCRLWLDPSPST